MKELIRVIPCCFPYISDSAELYDTPFETVCFAKKMALVRGLSSAWLRGGWTGLLARNVSTTCVVSAQAKPSTGEDPVQKLFLEKMKEYKQKSKGGSLPDSTPAFEARYKEEMDKVKRQFGGGDLDKFPQFDFKDE